MLEELVRAVTGRDPVGWTGLSGPTRAGLGQRELGRAVAGLGRHCWTGALDSDRVVPALAWGGVDPRSRDEESGPGFGLRAWGIAGTGIRPWASRGFGRGRAEGKSVWEPRFAAGLTAEAIACWECLGLALGTFAYKAVARCSAGCRPCWDGCALLRDRRLAVQDSSSESAYVKGCVRNACSLVSGRRGDLWRVFALAMRMRSHFRRPQCEGSKVPVGHARAYRDILNDALVALSIIRRARRLRTLLVKAVSNCLDSMLGLPTVLEEESTLDG
ncbi:hypothetical protein CRG98_039742 [Punica granatum]|uniref:Uncharacterized protein n=1 Tax=Punica granatum TaxID=22663 RepID=A0A2I0I7B3_PUNGR|nr:hypothetical protein CRG98_039742 [Punica granatum]